VALPELSVPPDRASATAALLHFERLPDLLFASIASANRHRYWDILFQLHAHRFVPDAPHPPSHSSTTRVIDADNEGALFCQDTWDSATYLNHQINLQLS